MGEDHTTPEEDLTGAERRRATVAEAAEVLGITAEAVRTRIKRGKLDSVKEPPKPGGTVYVLLDAEQTRPNTDPTAKGQDLTADQTGRDELVERLREEVAYLRGVIATRTEELARRDEEIRRRDEALEREQRLAAFFAERIRELEAPASEAEAGGDSRDDAERERDEVEIRPREGWTEPRERAGRPSYWWLIATLVLVLAVAVAVMAFFAVTQILLA